MSMSINPTGASANWWLPPLYQPAGSSPAASATASIASSSQTPATTASAPTAADLASVFQQFATDLQSMLAQAGAETTSPASTAAAATPGTTASTDQTSTQQAGGAHHHHHHHGGGSAGNAANQLVNEVDQLLNGGTTSIANIGSTIATDVMQALQSYGSLSTQQTNGTLATTA